MGFIFIGLVASAAVFTACLIWQNRTSGLGDFRPFLLTTCLLFTLGLAAGIFLPTGGYQPKAEVKTEVLPPFMDLTTPDANGLLLYVGVNSNDSYTYYAVVKSEYADDYYKSYVPKTLRDSHVSIVFEEDCKSPRLVEYREKPNVTFWSFAAAATKTSYTFYVPKDTVLYRNGAK